MCFKVNNKSGVDLNTRTAESTILLKGREGMEEQSGYWNRSFWEGRRRLSRRQLIRAGALAGMAAAVGLPAIGCSSEETKQPATAKATLTPQTGQPKSGGILKIGVPFGRGYLFPGMSSSGWDQNFMHVIGDALVYTSPDGSPDPEASLAASWKLEDPTTLTLSLRQGVKFHDGTDFDAPAMKYWFEYLLDETKAKQFSYRSQIETVKSFEVVDKSTLRLSLKQPDPALMSGLGGNAGIPVSPTAIDKLGPDIATQPAMTGPFSVKSFTAGGEWVFVKNPSYWRKGLPYLDGITFVEIPDDRVRAASIQSGLLDVAFFAQASDVTDSLKKEASIDLSTSPSGPSVLTVNHSLPPMDNLKIRQAVAHCIDKEVIFNVVYGGAGEAAKGGLITPGQWAYTDVSSVSYKFDINRAKELIKESGLKTPVSLKLMTNDSPDRLLIAQLTRDWLSDAGFDVNMEVFAPAEATRRVYAEGSVHLAPATLPSRPDPQGTFVSWATSTANYNPAGKKGKDPAQARIDELANAGGSSYDQKERKKAYDELQRIQAQSVIANITLTYRVVALACRKNVGGRENIWLPAWSGYRPQFLWRE